MAFLGISKLAGWCRHSFRQAKDVFGCFKTARTDGVGPVSGDLTRTGRTGDRFACDTRKSVRCGRRRIAQERSRRIHDRWIDPDVNILGQTMVNDASSGGKHDPVAAAETRADT